MALNLEGKKAIVSEVSKVAAESVSALSADYRGLTVTEMTKLRVSAREAGVYVRVVRNTLAKRALKDTEFECISDSLSGPMLLAFGKNELSAPARLFKDYVKQFEKLEVKALAVGGQVYDSNSLDAIAMLPTKDEAISRLMAVMQAPIAKLVRTLAAPQLKLVRTVVAVKEKKEAASA